MRKTLQRGLCFLLCVVMAFSCMTFSASAAVVIAPAITAAAKVVGPFIGSWLAGKVLDASLQKLKDWVDKNSTDTDGLIATIGALRTAQKTEVSLDHLRELAYEWNATCSEAVGFTVDVVKHRIDTGEEYYVIAVRRGYVVTSGAVQYCLADGINRILYANATTELSGRWVKDADSTGRQLLTSYEALWNLAQEVGGYIRQNEVWYEIYKYGGYVYCNVSGRRFSTLIDKDSSAVSQNRPLSTGSGSDGNLVSKDMVDPGDTIYIKEGDTYYSTNYDITNIEEGDTWYIKEGDNYYEIVIDNSQHIDIDNMTQVLPGGVLNEIDSLIYDDNTKTYYVDSHDVTNNETNFYLYQYHINYTSVTYIGYTEQYDKHYELYYQLPDGRDSADLTTADLEQLSVSFKDVVNYNRSADDLNQRSLYHFDGDTRDSSYWSYATRFDWVKGASLTYMDEGTFGGSLYLDETEHEFLLTLPSRADAAGDWTLQFRYYQSYTASPQKDSWINIDGLDALLMDGAQYYTGTGTAIAKTSVGAWNELCLMRKDGKLYYFINGVYYTNETFGYDGSDIRFHFGDSQQTYKKIDELRFTRGALYGREGYTPTSVPYDSNLTLVLPDDKVPMADEVAVFNPGANNLFTAKGLDDWTVSGVVSNVKTWPSGIANNWSYAFTLSSYVKQSVLYGASNSVKSGAGYATLSAPIYLPVCSYCVSTDFENGDSRNVEDTDTLYAKDTAYTLSVVLSDGTYSSVTFQVVYEKLSSWAYDNGSRYKMKLVGSDISSSVEVSIGTLSHRAEDDYGRTDFTLERLVISAPSSAEIVHMELVKGSAPEWSISYEGAVYDPGELEDSPVLAVRSNTPITTYQIGGVRPSYPKKGQVYAMVENGYITSLQQYTGSAWEAVDGRIWTGSRWIPASSYNVITMQDMYDIVDATPDYEYIYTESGFWDWFQKAWKDLIARLDKIIEGQGGSDRPGSDCQHVYESKIDKDATCTEPGHKVYTCSTCGHTYTELIEALGHDWIVTNTVPDVLDEAGAVVEEGYDELTCSRCSLISKDYGEGPIETDLFEALGDLIAGGISWALDKLTELVSALTSITETFNSFVDRVGALAGTFPLFFAAFFALIPEDLTVIMWFGVICFVVLGVWRKWSK